MNWDDSALPLYLLFKLVPIVLWSFWPVMILLWLAIRGMNARCWMKWILATSWVALALFGVYYTLFAWGILL